MRWWWCHTVGCPNYDKAKQINVHSDYRATCSFCRTKMRLLPPGDLAEDAIPENIILGEE